MNTVRIICLRMSMCADIEIDRDDRKVCAQALRLRRQEGMATNHLSGE